MQIKFCLVRLENIQTQRLRRQKYDPVIIDRKKGFVPGPSTILYRSFLKHCALTNKAVGTIRFVDILKIIKPFQTMNLGTIFSDVYQTPLLLNTGNT